MYFLLKMGGYSITRGYGNFQCKFNPLISAMVPVDIGSQPHGTGFSITIGGMRWTGSRKVFEMGLKI